MTATKPEIGTNSAATLYAQGESIRTTVEKMLLLATQTVERVEPLDTRLTNVEAILIELLSALQKLDVTTVQTADQAIISNEYLVALQGKTEAIHLQGVESLEQHKMTQMTLGTFVGWFTPILDEFRDTSIIPMLNKIDGKTSELLESHTAIKTLAQQAVDKVTPMLDKLEKSPILSMLGVK